MFKFYKFLIILSPWVLLAGLFQFHFQSLLPYQGVFKGQYPFDYFTIIDIFVSFLILVFCVGVILKKIYPQNEKLLIEVNSKKLSPEFLICIALLGIAVLLQFFLQKEYLPILNQPLEYFRSLFIYPIIFVLLIYKTLEQKTLNKLVFSYLLMIGFFCLLALIQYFFALFPGENKDFTGRLVWPYVDYITLKSSSSNWVAFFVTSGLILALIEEFHRLKNKIFDRKFYFFLIVILLSGLVIYLVQSYGAYMAIFVAILLFFFRVLKFKQFLLVLLMMLLIGGTIFLMQKNSYKFRILSNQIESYRYESSVSSRKQIYKMNINIIKDHPWLGVGLNQYQSYFRLNQERVLGKSLNESHVPPHAHNFFMGFWSNLGILGFLGILVLLVGIFIRFALNPLNPGLFVLVAILIHGLIDSYYWKQEIAYNFWIFIMLAYFYRLKTAIRK